MHNLRFRLPSFFSSDAPSRLTSGPASAAAATPPPPPPTPRPPFRPAGIAQPPPKSPSPKTTSPKTEPKAPSLVRSKSARKGVATAACSSASPSSSRGVATSAQQTKHMRQSKQTVSPLKKHEEEPKAAVESRTKNENAGEKVKGAEDAIKEINQVERKRKNAEEAKEQQKKKEEEKLAIQETKKVVREGREDATQSRIIRPVVVAIEPARAARDQLETKTQNRQQSNERSEIQGNGDDAKNPKTPANDPKTRSLLINSLVNPDGEGSSMSKRITEDIKDGISKLTWGKNNPNNDEKPVTVVTLTGENRGATMQMASDKVKTDSSVHIHRGYRSNPDESPYSTGTDNEDGRNFNTRKNPKEEESLVKTYVNCNAQSINNSIVFDSSVAEHDPGAHVSLRMEEARKASGSPDNATAKKPETVVAPPEKKATYEPRVRRRCLRGLLAESSESETENPQKPRRHGCRFSCKGKDNDGGIF